MSKLNEMINQYNQLSIEDNELEAFLLWENHEDQEVQNKKAIVNKKITELVIAIEAFAAVTEEDKNLLAAFLRLDPESVYNTGRDVISYNVNPDLLSRALQSGDGKTVNITKTEYKALAYLLTIKNYNIETYYPNVATPALIAELENGIFNVSPETDLAIEDYVAYASHMEDIDLNYPSLI